MALTLTEDRVYWIEGSQGEDAVRSGPRRGGEPVDHLTVSAGLRALTSTNTGVVFTTFDGLVRIDGS